MKNEVPSNVRELDYRVVKPFTTCGLRNSSISILVLGKLYREYGEKSFTKGELFLYTDPNVLGELLLDSYIEKVVDDPVVKVGDFFKKSTGSKYSVIEVDHNEFMLIDLNSFRPYDIHTVTSDQDGNLYLSMLVGSDSLSLFTPCKIEIREVEE